MSVAEAKNHLPSLIHEVEGSTTPLEITRRGKTVAFLISAAAYEPALRMEGLVAGLARIRAKYGRGSGFTAKELRTLRDGAVGRDFAFDDVAPSRSG
ncbi:MAG: Antitoxin [Gemmatimonadetes bacterium]|nr:Antitoxin [Gemmatimonadota bacterium]